MISEKISIIVPVYNAEKYLEKCLDSILFQTHRDIEIIAVDDGSGDGSGKICDEYAKKDGRMTVIHKPNGGPSSARNAGLEKAVGEWVAFADSDDYLEPDLCEYLLELAQKHNADIVQCGAFWEDGRQNRTVFSPDEDMVFAAGACGFSPEAWRTYANANWGKLYRRKNICDLRFDSRYCIGEDLNFNLLALEKAGCIVLGSEPKYHYVQSEGSLIRTAPSRDKLLNCRMMLHEMKTRFSENEKMLKHVEDEILRNDLDICSKIAQYRIGGVSDVIKTVRKEVRTALARILSGGDFSTAEKLKFVLIAWFWPLYGVLLRASKR